MPFDGIDDEVRTSVNPRGLSFGLPAELAKIQQKATTAAQNSSTQRSAELWGRARNIEYRDRRIQDQLGGRAVHKLRGPQGGHKSATAAGRHATGHQAWRRPPPKEEEEEEEQWMEEMLEEDLGLVRTASYGQPTVLPPAAFTLGDFLQL